MEKLSILVGGGGNNTRTWFTFIPSIRHLWLWLLNWEFITNGLSPIQIQVSVRIDESVDDEDDKVEEDEYEIRDDLQSAGVRVRGRG